MYRTILAVLTLVFALAFPAAAYIPTVQAMGASRYDDSAVNGTLTNTGDRLTIYTAGTKWATVYVTVQTGGTLQVSFQTTSDKQNWIAAPYARRIDVAGGGNPSYQSFAGAGATLSTGNVWEVALPANAVAFSIAATTTANTATISIEGGRLYLPGVPVVTTLYDVTTGTGAALDTGTLDLTGWSQALAFIAIPATGGGSVTMIDDTGGNFGANFLTLQAGSTTWIEQVRGPVASTTNLTVTTGGYFLSLLPARERWQSNAVASATSRLRIEVSR